MLYRDKRRNAEESMEALLDAGLAVYARKLIGTSAVVLGLMFVIGIILGIAGG